MVGFDRPPSHQPASSPPSPLFDGMRLGLEGAMLATLAIAIPAGLHIGLSAALGYAVRYSGGLPPEPKAFSLFGFLLASSLGFFGASMGMFLGATIPSMLYSIGLVALMLRWVGRRRAHAQRASLILGGVLGLVMGILLSGTGFLLMGLRPGWATYARFFHWPEILTFNGVALLWLSLLPVVTGVAGALTGRKLGEQLEAMTLFWIWY